MISSGELDDYRASGRLMFHFNHGSGTIVVQLRTKLNTPSFINNQFTEMTYPALSALTAVSPIDGRYADKCQDLRNCFSEYALIRERVRVELAWLVHLGDQPGIKEFPAIDAKTKSALLAIGTDFSVEDAAEVKQIEATTNHDVKAVEYFIKSRLTAFPDLNAKAEFVHFACTSEDINNLAYACMLRVTETSYCCHKLIR